MSHLGGHIDSARSKTQTLHRFIHGIFMTYLAQVISVVSDK